MSDAPTLSDPHDLQRALDVAPDREARPSGESGGHTVQDWEQPPAGRHATLSDAVLDDDPSPPTIPLYLRTPPEGDAVADVPEPAFDAGTQILTAQTGALIDSLTRGFADAIAEAMRPIVSSSVSRLLPMLLSLGSVPDDDAQAGSGASDTSPKPSAT